MTETICKSGGFTLGRVGDYAIAKANDPIDRCEICSGTGLLLGETTAAGRRYETATPCPRALMIKRLNLFSDAKLPAVHHDATLENFSPATQEQDSAKRLSRDFIQKWPEVRGLVLSGPVGTGKTHLLTAIIKALTIERGVKAGYIEISLLFATIRRGFAEGKSGGEIIGPLSQLELLAIDEIGKGRGSPFEMETLDELIARRYNAGKVTLFATNYSLSSPEEKTGGYKSSAELKDAGKESKLLFERVGDRIYSRLTAMCEFVQFPVNTPDKRRDRATASRPSRSSS